MSGGWIVWWFVLAPLLCAAAGYVVGWLVRCHAVELSEDAAYDRGWDNCSQALGFGKPVEQLVNDPGPPIGRRPGRHASTQLPDPPKATGGPALPGSPGEANIGRKTS